MKTAIVTCSKKQIKKTEFGIFLGLIVGLIFSNSSLSVNSIYSHTAVECESTSSTIDVTTCDSYTLNGQIYTSSGVYNQLLMNSEGCDSIITINLTINSGTNYTIEASACGSYTLNYETYTSSGIYLQTLSTSFGCDSILTLDLTINESDITVLNKSICSGEYYNFYGLDLNTEGMFIQSLTNQYGCDSTVILNLTIHNLDTTQLTKVICNGDSYEFFDSSLTESGTYVKVVANQYGCDSIIVLNLMVNKIEASVARFNDTLVVTIINKSTVTYQWINGSTIVEGETNSWFVPSTAGSYAVIVSDGVCSDTSTYSPVASGFVTNLKEHKVKNTINVFPNPAIDLLRISSTNNELQSVEIINETGQFVYRTNMISSLIVDMNSFAPGIYILKVGNGKNLYNTKVLKQ